jgi:putative hemolysin
MKKLCVGSLEAFVAKKEKNILAAQQLRYRVFVEEMGGNFSDEVTAQKRDFDKFDDWCDHLLVRDTSKDIIVGAYRILRRSNLPAGEKFYTQSEFDLTKPLEYFKGEVMELGRSCVDAAYRDRSTMQLLWKAIGEYIYTHEVELMFGCASFAGSNSAEHTAQLSYLYTNHLAPAAYRPSVRPEFRHDIKLIDESENNARRTLASLPPLLKGYLRLGGVIGDGAFEDKDANSTDVCIMVVSAIISEKYKDKFSPEKI